MNLNLNITLSLYNTKSVRLENTGLGNSLHSCSIAFFYRLVIMQLSNCSHHYHPKRDKNDGENEYNEKKPILNETITFVLYLSFTLI